jgi:RNA polymerase sigma-70 factor (ECF subfamily)
MSAHLASDQELINQYLKGKDIALERLIHRHKDKVYTSIYMMVRDQCLAEDIFQDTFIKVIDTLRAGKYNEEGKFLPWVLRISYNLCIDHFRRVKRLPKITDSDGKDIFNVLKFSDKSPEDVLMESQYSAKVKLLIEQLPEEQKEVVMLRHYFNFSFKEIAELTDVSINTSLGRMRYALINLRKLIEEKQISL